MVSLVVSLVGSLVVSLVVTWRPGAVPSVVFPLNKDRFQGSKLGWLASGAEAGKRLHRLFVGLLVEWLAG